MRLHTRLNTRLHTLLTRPGATLRVGLLPLAFVAFAAFSPSAYAQVVISQVYGGGGNAGATLRHDFIELKNRSTTAQSVGGWSVQYTSAAGGTWQVTALPAGTTIPAGAYLLVRQAAGTGGTVDVPGDITGTIAMAGASGKVALANSATPLSGTVPVGAGLIDAVSYGTANGIEGTPTPVLSNTTAALRNGGGCDDTGNNINDFSVGAPAPRNSTAAAEICSGGGGGGGGGGGIPMAATIPAIQGSGGTSTMAGQLVITSGVVTRVNSNGFFIQDLSGDGNPATSDGLFVFSGATLFPDAVPGNLITVTGTVAEFASGAGTVATPLTQIANPTSVSFQGAGYSITPVTVNLPLAPGESLERFEGMLVRIEGALIVQQNFLQARFGQLTLGAGRHETPTNRHRPNSPQALALADLQARSRVMLDDGASTQNPSPTPYFGSNGLPRAGDTVSNLVGTLDFGLSGSSSAGPGLYRLHPVAAPIFTATNPRPRALAGLDNDKTKIAAMNVLNYFTTFTNGQTADGQTGQGCTLGTSTSAGNCRGASNLPEFQRQRDKIVRALAGLDADVVGLMEIQNNGNVAAQNLVDALNAQVRSGPWAVAPLPANSPGIGTGTDAIRVAVIYKPAKVTLVGVAISDTDPVNNRPTLAQTFAAPGGERFTVVVNHLKSKGSCPGAGDPDAAGNLDAGDGQGCWNGTRVQQVQRLRTFVAQLQQNSGTNDVLIVGDMNAYGQEDPIFELTSNGFIDQAARYNSFAYTYVFDAMAGRLDHAIASASMSPKIVATKLWHINADEQIAFDYNLESKQPACATCAPDPADRYDPYRSSDHDPILVVVDFAITRGKATAARSGRSAAR